MGRAEGRGGREDLFLWCCVFPYVGIVKVTFRSKHASFVICEDKL
jgi:hypothetical protein